MDVRAEAVTEDALLDGRVRLRQPVAGYRAATDPVLLAAACPARAGESALDLGCGAGAAALCLAARVAGMDLHGLEVQPAYAALARENAGARACGADGARGRRAEPARGAEGAELRPCADQPALAWRGQLRRRPMRGAGWRAGRRSPLRTGSRRRCGG